MKAMWAGQQAKESSPARADLALNVCYLGQLSSHCICLFRFCALSLMLCQLGYAGTPKVDFVASQNAVNTRLTWQSEVGERYWIERSSDLGTTQTQSGRWAEVATKQGDGSELSWTDPDPRSSKMFYRIRQATTWLEVASYGDSITAGSSYRDDQVPGILTLETSYMMWAQAYLSGRFENMSRGGNFTSPLDFGFPGAKIADLAAGATFAGSQPMATLLGRSPKLVVELSGTNDCELYWGVTAAGVASARVANWDYLLANGVKRIIAIAIPPLSTGTPGGINQTALADAANALLQASAATRPVTWVPYPAVLKKDGTVNSDYYRDDLHPNALGAQKLGQAVAAALEPYVPVAPFAVPEDGSPRWLTFNPYMAGSMPMSDGTGVRATGGWDDWFGVNGNLVGSKVTDAAGVWQRFTMGGLVENQSGAQEAVFWHLDTLKTVPAGTKIRSVARIRTTDPVRSIGMAYVQQEVNNRSGLFAGQGHYSNGNYPLDLENFDLLFLGPVTVMKNTGTVNIWFTPAGNGTLDFTQCGVISVP
jgi:hypothetical protein